MCACYIGIAGRRRCNERRSAHFFGGLPVAASDAFRLSVADQKPQKFMSVLKSSVGVTSNNVDVK